MFIDQAQIYVCSGKGGDGVVHFRREKYIPHGGPDGGDGGKGGAIVFEVLPTLNTLSSLRHKNRFIGNDGKRGAKSNMTGRSGEDLIIHVPPGTIIYDDDSGDVVGDLVEPGQRLVVVLGGRGGRGNARFATSVQRVPRVAERGEPGVEKNLRLELKLIADIGIVGVPNAGKSTLLSASTNAKPKIAPYPFTTLEPNLGVVSLDYETTLILADIPGLIEGAHLGVGLGHDFLRHIQRTRVLVHILDGMAEDPLLDFIQINSELALFDPELAEKPQIVAFNKMDLLDAQDHWELLEPELKKLVKDNKIGVNIAGAPIPISAVSGENVRKLLYRASQVLAELPPVEEITALPVYRVEEDPNEFTVSKEFESWRISGKSIERAAAMTYWEHHQSIRRFQRILETLGIDDALRQAGVQEGDTVLVGDHELEWQD